MTTELKERISHFAEYGILQENVPAFLRSLGFYTSCESMSELHWSQAISELEAIADEGLLHEYINYIKLNEGIHEVQGDDAHGQYVSEAQ